MDTYVYHVYKYSTVINGYSNPTCAKNRKTGWVCLFASLVPAICNTLTELRDVSRAPK